MNIMAQKPVEFIIETPLGNMEGVLYDDTPLHRDNFVKLIQEKWYDGSEFHRVINNFMIQGGQGKDGLVDPGYKVPAEISKTHIHKKGVLAAARMSDYVNPKKESSGSQFYIVQGTSVTQEMLNTLAQQTGMTYTAEQIATYKKVGGTPHLDNQYTVFGEITKGFEIIDKLAAVKTDKMDKPVDAVIMNIKIKE
jgi:peptidyl-prolyl cis-trans isomerase B (cyclophilin B)